MSDVNSLVAVTTSPDGTVLGTLRILDEVHIDAVDPGDAKVLEGHSGARHGERRGAPRLGEQLRSSGARSTWSTWM